MWLMQLQGGRQVGGGREWGWGEVGGKERDVLGSPVEAVVVHDDK